MPSSSRRPRRPITWARPSAPPGSSSASSSSPSSALPPLMPSKTAAKSTWKSRAGLPSALDPIGADGILYSTEFRERSSIHRVERQILVGVLHTGGDDERSRFDQLRTGSYAGTRVDGGGKQIGPLRLPVAEDEEKGVVAGRQRDLRPVDRPGGVGTGNIAHRIRGLIHVEQRGCRGIVIRIGVGRLEGEGR